MDRHPEVALVRRESAGSTDPFSAQRSFLLNRVISQGTSVSQLFKPGRLVIVECADAVDASADAAA